MQLFLHGVKGIPLWLVGFGVSLKDDFIVSSFVFFLWRNRQLTFAASFGDDDFIT